MAAVDGSAIFYGIESSPKTLAATAPLTKFPFQSADPTATYQFSPSGEARDDFFDTEEDQVAKDTGLQFVRKFRPYVYDSMIESAMFGRFIELTRRTNAYGGGTQMITGVAAATDTYTVTDEAADFAQYDLVRAVGFTNAGNNGLKLAQATTGATSLVTQNGLVDEATPPVGAALEKVGVYGAAGDFAISGGDIVSTANFDFEAAGMYVGQWLKVGGDATVSKFATAAVNDAIRIGPDSDLANGVISPDRTPVGWADDAGATKTIYLFMSEVCLPANNPLTMYWLAKIRRDSDFFWRGHQGMYTSRLQLAGQARGDFIMTVELDGLDFEDNATDISAQAGGPISPPLYPAMVAGLAGQRLYADGVYKTKNMAVRSSQMEISPTLVPIDIEGCFGFDAMDRSTQVFRLNGEAHFRDDTIYAPFANATKLDFARVMQAGTGAYVFEAPRQQFLQNDINLPGIGQNITLNFGSKATADDAGIAAGNLVNFFAVHRFRWAEGWPNLC